MEYLILTALYFIPLLLCRYLVLKTAEGAVLTTGCLVICFIPLINIFFCFVGVFIWAEQAKFWQKVTNLFFYGRITK